MRGLLPHGFPESRVSRYSGVDTMLLNMSCAQAVTIQVTPERHLGLAATTVVALALYMLLHGRKVRRGVRPR